MSEIISFSFSDTKIRTLILGGEPCFVASDVCRILDIMNSRDAVARLPDKMKGVGIADTPGGKQQVTCISEAGLYKLAFTSRKEEAEKFTDWVATEVIPSIRQHGGYMTPETIEKVLADPDTIIQLATRLKEHQAELLAQDSYIKTLEPKAEFFDAVAGSRDAISIGDAAKVLDMGVGQNKLFSVLRREQILQDNNIPYQIYIDRGYFRVVEQKFVVKGETRISIRRVRLPTMVRIELTTYSMRRTDQCDSSSLER